MDKRLVNLSADLDGLIEFGISELLEKLGQKAGTIGSAFTKGAAPVEEAAAQMGHAGPFTSMSGSPPLPVGPGPMNVAGAAGTAAPSAAANVAAKVRGKKMPPSIGTLGGSGQWSYAPKGAAAPGAAAAATAPVAPPPGKLVWGGQEGISKEAAPAMEAGYAAQAGRGTGARDYLAKMNAGPGTQANAAQSAAQKAGMAKRGMTGPVGGDGQGMMGTATDWWNKQKTGTKMAIGVGAGALGGYAASSLMDKDRSQQYSSWLDDIIELGSQTRVIRLAKKSGVKIFESAEETFEFADPRPRNPLGEFQSQGEGGPDPNKMATVYKQPGLLSTALKGGSLALAGGALGQVGGEGGKQLLDQIKKRSKAASKSIRK